eukprot:TRINITY_DN5500_c0_g3_i1.p1 TRINITY_DN5500_c0_g3~~TRINITY_DN5500_c0_g3_i1.p1  ORF type:complete len:1652 (-),score=317.01 TRINITY_DN5500_c0_g3_i1:577-5034(-)
MAYFQCGYQALHVPLACLIDYRGFRMMAMSYLPIDKRTINYGSSDGGKTVHNINDRLSDLIKNSAEVLNLKGHLVSGQKLYSAGDLEGHIGRDGRFYLLDFARIFPPEPFSNRESARDAMVKLLRPELVRDFKSPLSSDAYSGFSIDDPNREIHEEEVRECFAGMKVTIEDLARYWDDTFDIENSKEFSKNIKTALHHKGINIRWMGYLRDCCTSSDLRKVLLTEMIARVVKCDANAKLRLKMKEGLFEAGEEIFKEVIKNHYNIILGGPGYENASNKYWEDMRSKIQDKFCHALDHDPEDMDLRESISSIVDLMDLVQEHTGAHFTEHAKYQFKEQKDQGFLVLISDMKPLVTKVKHMNISILSYAVALSLQAQQASRNKTYGAAKRLFREAHSWFTLAIHSTVVNATTYHEWSNTYFFQAMNTVDEEKRKTLLYEARDKCIAANNIRPNDYRILSSMVNICYVLGKQSKNPKERLLFYFDALDSYRGCIMCLEEYGHGEDSANIAEYVFSILEFLKDLDTDILINWIFDGDFNRKDCIEFLVHIAQKYPIIKEEIVKDIFQILTSLLGDIRAKNILENSVEIPSTRNDAFYRETKEITEFFKKMFTNNLGILINLRPNIPRSIKRLITKGGSGFIPVLRSFCCYRGMPISRNQSLIGMQLSKNKKASIRFEMTQEGEVWTQIRSAQAQLLLTSCYRESNIAEIENYLQLYRDLCIGDNHKNIKHVLKRICSKKCMYACISDEKLPITIRSLFIDLYRVTTVDIYPHNFRDQKMLWYINSKSNTESKIHYCDINKIVPDQMNNFTGRFPNPENMGEFVLDFLFNTDNFPFEQELDDITIANHQDLVCSVLELFLDMLVCKDNELLKIFEENELSLAFVMEKMTNILKLRKFHSSFIPIKSTVINIMHHLYSMKNIEEFSRMFNNFCFSSDIAFEEFENVSQEESKESLFTHIYNFYENRRSTIEDNHAKSCQRAYALIEQLYYEDDNISKKSFELVKTVVGGYLDGYIYGLSRYVLVSNEYKEMYQDISMVIKNLHQYYRKNDDINLLKSLERLLDFCVPNNTINREVLRVLGLVPNMVKLIVSLHSLEIFNLETGFTPEIIILCVGKIIELLIVFSKFNSTNEREILNHFEPLLFYGTFLANHQSPLLELVSNLVKSESCEFVLNGPKGEVFLSLIIRFLSIHDFDNETVHSIIVKLICYVGYEDFMKCIPPEELTFYLHAESLRDNIYPNTLNESLFFQWEIPIFPFSDVDGMTLKTDDGKIITLSEFTETILQETYSKFIAGIKRLYSGTQPLETLLKGIDQCYDHTKLMCLHLLKEYTASELFPPTNETQQDFVYRNKIEKINQLLGLDAFGIIVPLLDDAYSIRISSVVSEVICKFLILELKETDGDIFNHLCESLKRHLTLDSCRHTLRLFTSRIRNNLIPRTYFFINFLKFLRKLAQVNILTNFSTDIVPLLLDVCKCISSEVSTKLGRTNIIGNRN